jgi:hypothetical protein
MSVFSPRIELKKPIASQAYKRAMGIADAGAICYLRDETGLVALGAIVVGRHFENVDLWVEYQKKVSCIGSLYSQMKNLAGERMLYCTLGDLTSHSRYDVVLS